MTTSPAQPGATFLARRPTPAHRCKARRNRPFSAATLTVALGLATVGGAAIGIPAASAATPTASSSVHAATPVDWQWGYGSPADSSPWDGSQWDGSQWGDPSQGDPSQSDPSQSGPAQSDPAQSSSAAANTSDASSSASVGMVEITSTLANGTAAGTGMVINSNGTVVTNHHVVEGATDIKVTVVSTGQTFQGRFIGADAEKDVAVLKLDGASGLKTVHLSSSAAKVGDDVTAVGDANGDGGSLTAAPGAVTALNQGITVQGEDGSAHQLADLIQVNADVIPGDSGGALLNSDGKVVGMNVAASSGSPDVQGFVIPISTVKSTAKAILNGDHSGAIQLGYNGYLGVGLDDDSSATIAGAMDGSAAADAGLQQGDTITSVDGQQVDSGTQLRSDIAAHQAGDHVKLTWVTADGEQQSATVTLGQAPVA